MSKHLGRPLDQLTLLQIDHEAGRGQPPYRLQGIFQNLLLRRPVDGDVIEVDDNRQSPRPWLASEHILNDELKMCRCLSEPHRHPQPPELTPMRDKGRVVRRRALEDNVVEARLQINHTYPLSSTQLCPIPTRIVQLVLVLISPLVYRNDILTYPIRLTRLLTWH